MSTIIKEEQHSNKVKYFIINGDSLIGFVYESDKHGRSLVFERENINLNKKIEIWEKQGGRVIDIDLLEYFQSIIFGNDF